jgi:NifU-like protein involved in Fe-S cluster formation
MINPQYDKKVMKRFFNPKYAGEIKNPSAVGQVGNAACGDVLRVFIKVEENKKTGEEKIKDIKFKTMGCVAAIASSDAVCEIAKGKSIKDAKKITKKDILKKVGQLPQIKYHCSILGEEALLKAIENYELKAKSKKN